MYSRSGALQKIIELIRGGLPNREVSRQTGAATTTVARARYELEKKERCSFLCKCGGRATHRGWCSYRFERSPARQEFIKMFGRKREDWAC